MSSKLRTTALFDVLYAKLLHVLTCHILPDILVFMEGFILQFKNRISV